MDQEQNSIRFVWVSPAPCISPLRELSLTSDRSAVVFFLPSVTSRPLWRVFAPPTLRTTALLISDVKKLCICERERKREREGHIHTHTHSHTHTHTPHTHARTHALRQAHAQEGADTGLTVSDALR